MRAGLPGEDDWPVSLVEQPRSKSFAVVSACLTRALPREYMRPF